MVDTAGSGGADLAADTEGNAGSVCGGVNPPGGGDQAYYRGVEPGQEPDFTPQPGEHKQYPDGTLENTHGVSVFDNPESILKKGKGKWSPREVDQSTIPDELFIDQRGTDPHHFEIMAREDGSLTADDFSLLCSFIGCN